MSQNHLINAHLDFIKTAVVNDPFTNGRKKLKSSAYLEGETPQSFSSNYGYMGERLM